MNTPLILSSRLTRRFLAPVAVAALTSTVLHSSIISINFGPTSENLLATDSAGLVAATNWNNATGNSNPSLTNLVDDSGVATTADLVNFSGGKPDGSLQGLGTISGAGVTASGAYTSTDPDVVMINGFLFGEFGGDNITPTFINFTIESLPTEFTTVGYEVYVYYDRPNNEPSDFTLTPSGGSGVTLATLDNNPANDGSSGEYTGTEDYQYFLGDNYQVFTGLTASSFDIEIESTDRPQINGLQIVAVPEPSTSILFLGLGALALVLGRRSRR